MNGTMEVFTFSGLLLATTAIIFPVEFDVPCKIRITVFGVFDGCQPSDGSYGAWNTSHDPLLQELLAQSPAEEATLISGMEFRKGYEVGVEVGDGSRFRSGDDYGSLKI